MLLETPLLVAGGAHVSTPTSISSVLLDPSRELLWVGSDQGYMSSYYIMANGENKHLERYTSWRAHFGPVRQILGNDHGVYTVGGSTVQHRLHRGMPQWTMRNENDMPMFSESFTSSKSEMLVGGQQKLSLLNVYRGTVVKQFECEESLAIMKISKLVCCGTTAGQIIFRDPRTLQIEHKIEAHSGSLSDFDVSGNILVSCGFSTTRAGQQVIEPLLRVFDIRTLKSLPPIPFPSGASLLKFHPTKSTTLLAASQNGQFQICDIVDPSSVFQYYQASLHGYVTSVSFSSAGDVIALGGSCGTVSFWSEKPELKFNNYSRDLEFADHVIPPPSIRVDSDAPLSLVGMPYYTTNLLSVWPGTKLFEVGQPPPLIPEEVLNDMKMIDFVGYAKNPGTFKRNQVMKAISPSRGEDGPRFRSEQEKKGMATAINALSLSDDAENSDSLQSDGIPRMYRQVEIKYSKFGVEDFDFGFYNKTRYGGLETHISNSYCNSLLQSFFFLRPLRDLVIVHMQSACPKENCLSCELGFLFKMLQVAEGSNCQASNFLKAFGTVPQASALGLFEPETPNSATSFSILIQNFHRFILEQVNQDTSSTDQAQAQQAVETPLQKIFGLRVQITSVCTCRNEDVRETHPFVVDLLSKSRTGTGPLPTLSERLHSSINRETTTRAWCARCSRYQPMQQKKCLIDCPNILSVNFGTLSEEELDGLTIPPRILIYTLNGTLVIQEDDFENTDIPEGASSAYYSLRSCVSEIKPERDPAHLVSHVYMPDEQQWYLFNDFLVQPIQNSDPMGRKKWKIPAIVQYVREDYNPIDSEAAQIPMNTLTLLTRSWLVNHRKDVAIKFMPLQPSDLPLPPEYLCAIDSEFVALSNEETELRSNGAKYTIRPAKQALARVSVIRGDNAIPFIDDYIHIREQVVDYLTEYSGIKQGDLDPLTSFHPLVTLKVAYQKLRLLVDMGCKFVGHGLKKDFRIINLFVPQNQIIDTVDIYFKKEHQRKLSLRFLAWSVLRLDIQQDTHDSIEDAKMALQLYNKYVETSAQGKFEELLDRVYEEGRMYNFKAPSMNPSMMNTVTD